MENKSLTNIKFLLGAIKYFEDQPEQIQYNDISKEDILNFSFIYIKNNPDYEVLTEEDFQKLTIKQIEKLLTKIAQEEVTPTVPPKIDQLVETAKTHSQEIAKLKIEGKYNKEASAKWLEQFNQSKKTTIPTTEAPSEKRVVATPDGINISQTENLSPIGTIALFVPRAIVALGGESSRNPVEAKKAWLRLNGISSLLLISIKTKAVAAGIFLSKKQGESLNELVNSLQPYERTPSMIYQLAMQSGPKTNLTYEQLDLLLSIDEKKSREFFSSRLPGGLSRGIAGRVAASVLDTFFVKPEKEIGPEISVSKEFTESARYGLESKSKDAFSSITKFLADDRYKEARRGFGLLSLFGGLALIVGGAPVAGAPLATTGAVTLGADLAAHYKEASSSLSNSATTASNVFVQVMLRSYAQTAVVILFVVLASFALIMFIINNNAYVVPPDTGVSTVGPIGGGVRGPNCLDDPGCPCGWPIVPDANEKLYIIQGSRGQLSHSQYDLEAIDISALTGHSVVATHTGEVAYTFADGQSNLYGPSVWIKSTCNGQQIYSMYTHLSVTGVREGESVIYGQEIGKSGPDGIMNDHLHYEFRGESGAADSLGPYPNDPPYMWTPYIPKDVPVGCSDRGPLCGDIFVP